MPRKKKPAGQAGQQQQQQQPFTAGALPAEAFQRLQLTFQRHTIACAQESLAILTQSMTEAWGAGVGAGGAAGGGAAAT